MATTPASFQVVKEVEAAVIGDQAPTPAAGSLELFANQNDTFYKKTSAGTVTPLVNGVTSFNARTGSVSPLQADYDAFFLTPAEGAASFDALGAAAAAQAAAIAASQPLDADLTALAAAPWALNAFPVGTGPSTLAQLTLAANTFAARSSTGNVAAKPITDYALASILVAANQAGLTALLGIATTTLSGAMAAFQVKKLIGLWTDAVADLGCDPTAGTNDTAKIQAWHDALPATGGATLFIPDQCFIRLDTAVALSKPDLTIQSWNRRTSGFVLNSAANNGFTCSADSIIFVQIRIIAGTPAGSPALRTGGFAIEWTSAGDSGGAYRCDFIYMWSCVRMSGPLQFLDGCTMREYGANAINGACVLLDGSGDRFIRKLLTDSTVPSAGHAGIRVAATASLLIDTCQIIHAGLALDLAPANGITVPSIDVINTYFDTSVVGLNCTGAGSVLRCKFTNCWFGSMSDSGIKFGPTGTGTVEGMTFENCYVLNNVGGTTVGVNITTALIGKVKFIGCAIAGWTTGVVTTAGTNCWPIFEGCNIGGWAAFGNNTTGFNIGAGTYKGLYILGSDCVDNTTPLTLGAVTATGSRFRIIDNAGINPRGNITPPAAAPATATTYTNTSGFRVQVIAKAATSITNVTINGTAFAVTLGANVPLSTFLDPGSTILYTLAGAGSWTWAGQ